MILCSLSSRTAKRPSGRISSMKPSIVSSSSFAKGLNPDMYGPASVCQAWSDYAAERTMPMPATKRKCFRVRSHRDDRQKRLIDHDGRDLSAVRPNAMRPSQWMADFRPSRATHGHRCRGTNKWRRVLLQPAASRSCSLEIHCRGLASLVGLQFV
jgi:hypothetical protein